MERRISLTNGAKDERVPLNSSIRSLERLERGERSLSGANGGKEARSSSITAMQRLGSLNAQDSHSLWSRLGSCLCYGLISVSITLFNKAVFSVYHFPFPSFVTTLQILISLVYMLALQHLKVFPLAFFWWLYVVSGVTALRYLNVPMYSVFRRSTTLLVVAGEWFYFNKAPSPLALGSIVVMIVGAIVAGATDLTYNPYGYIFVSICAASTAVYLLLIRVLKDRTGLSQSGLLYYNNVLALPMMVITMLLMTTDVQQVIKLPQIRDPMFLIFLVLSASQAFLLNLCIFWCTTVNSPLATTVTGQMKDIATIGLGMFLFGDVVFNLKNFTGVCVGLSGGILYSFLSYWERNKKESARR